MAEAVKALAGQVEASSKAIVSAIASLHERIDRFSAELTENRDKPSSIHAAFHEVEADVQRISTSAAESGQQMRLINERAHELQREVAQASHGLKIAFDGSDRFLKMSEDLVEQIAQRSGKVVFCIAADRNGYIATHNRKYCQSQRPGDTLWITANVPWPAAKSFARHKQSSGLFVSGLSVAPCQQAASPAPRRRLRRSGLLGNASAVLAGVLGLVERHVRAVQRRFQRLAGPVERHAG